jgi:hypothetical protein
MPSVAEYASKCKRWAGLELMHFITEFDCITRLSERSVLNVMKTISFSTHLINFYNRDNVKSYTWITKLLQRNYNFYFIQITLLIIEVKFYWCYNI